MDHGRIRPGMKLKNNDPRYLNVIEVTAIVNRYDSKNGSYAWYAQYQSGNRVSYIRCDGIHTHGTKRAVGWNVIDVEQLPKASVIANDPANYRRAGTVTTNSGDLSKPTNYQGAADASHGIYAAEGCK